MSIPAMPVRPAAVTVTALAVLLACAVSGCSGGSSGGGGGTGAGATGGAPTSTTSTTSTATVGTKGGATSAPRLPEDTSAPRVAISKAPVVPIGQVSRITPQVLVRVRSVSELTVKATSPGDVAGPAVAVTVAVTNDSTAPFAVAGLVVTASYHGGLPGDETDAGPSDPMTGSVQPGRTATGVYVFRVPSRYASTLRLEITSDRSPTIVRFTR